ncbi:MAG: alpha/beta hydrolase [Lysobacter sp.]
MNVSPVGGTRAVEDPDPDADYDVGAPATPAPDTGIARDRIAVDLPVQQRQVTAADGHQWSLLAVVPLDPKVCVLWLPALGVAARHYLPFAQALAARGAAVFLHEWRGHGSSTLRAGRDRDWGYRQLLELDLPASEIAMGHAVDTTVARVLGGHSLGGQLASCRLALSPQAAGGIWLVGSGAPWWRAFRRGVRWWLLVASHILPWLARVNGALPGRRIGFGGREAPGLIADWAATARSGIYAASGTETSLEAALSEARPTIRAVLLAGDWYAPAGSLHWLLDKMPLARVTLTTLDDTALGARADHFQWMQHPDAVAATLMEGYPDQEPAGASAGEAESLGDGDGEEARARPGCTAVR